ncbi:hypothetical protein V6N13_064639 [Hibiscus sabdariffa]
MKGLLDASKRWVSDDVELITMANHYFMDIFTSSSPVVMWMSPYKMRSELYWGSYFYKSRAILRVANNDCIWSAKGLITNGMGWHIGIGQHINIWSEEWLLRPE